MGTEARIQHMETEKLEVYFLCKRVREKTEAHEVEEQKKEQKARGTSCNKKNPTWV